MFDGSEETPWNSEQGKPQWIVLKFEKPVFIHSVNMMFQGGFVGQQCTFQSINERREQVDSWPFYPNDINYLQE